MGHFVSSPRKREKRDRIDSRGEGREGQGRKRNRNESEETEEIKTFPSTLTCYMDIKPCPTVSHYQLVTQDTFPTPDHPPIGFFMRCKFALYSQFHSSPIVLLGFCFGAKISFLPVLNPFICPVPIKWRKIYSTCTPPSPTFFFFFFDKQNCEDNPQNQRILGALILYFSIVATSAFCQVCKLGSHAYIVHIFGMLHLSYPVM